MDTKFWVTYAMQEYDFSATYAALEAAYRGEYDFTPKVAPLFNSDAQLRYLPNPDVAVLNAKYLIDSFVTPVLWRFSEAVIDQFEMYSSTVSTSITTSYRATNFAAKSLKISRP